MPTSGDLKSGNCPFFKVGELASLGMNRTDVSKMFWSAVFEKV